MLVEIMCYCCGYYAGWSIYRQATLMTIHTWTQIVEMGYGHGYDQTIKQEYILICTLIYQWTLSLQTTSLTLSSFCLTLGVFVSFAVKFKLKSHVSHDAYTQLVDTGEMGSSCNSSFLILALAFQLVQPCIQYSHLNCVRLHLLGA